MHSVSFPKAPADPPHELRVTIAIGAALIVQSGLALIWAGAASERLTQLERRADRTGEIIERTVRLEEQSRFMSETLIRIEKKIDNAQGEGK